MAESKGSRAADRIAHLKKGEMAAEAETLLAGSGWVPEPLRTPGRALPEAAEPATVEDEAEAAGPDQVAEAEAIADAEPSATDEEAESDLEPAHALAAE